MFKPMGLAAAFVILVEALSSGVVLAADNYGAISTSDSSNAWGLTYDYPSQEEAESAALDQCSKVADDCKSRVWFMNSCGAVAHNDTHAGWGLGDTRAEAEANAKKALDNDGEIVAWSCTTR